MRSKGYVKNIIDPARRFGFIKDTVTGNDVFFHISALVPGQDGVLPIQYGDKVSFEIGINGQGKTYCKDLLITEPFQ